MSAPAAAPSGVPAWLTIPQAAKVSGYSQRTMYRRVGDGTIASTSMKSSRRINTAYLCKLLDIDERTLPTLLGTNRGADGPVSAAVSETGSALGEQIGRLADEVDRKGELVECLRDENSRLREELASLRVALRREEQAKSAAEKKLEKLENKILENFGWSRAAQ